MAADLSPEQDPDRVVALVRALLDVEAASGVAARRRGADRPSALCEAVSVLSAAWFGLMTANPRPSSGGRSGAAGHRAAWETAVAQGLGRSAILALLDAARPHARGLAYLARSAWVWDAPARHTLLQHPDLIVRLRVLEAELPGPAGVGSASAAGDPTGRAPGGGLDRPTPLTRAEATGFLRHERDRDVLSAGVSVLNVPPELRTTWITDATAQPLPVVYARGQTQANLDVVLTPDWAGGPLPLALLYRGLLIRPALTDDQLETLIAHAPDVALSWLRHRHTPWGRVAARRLAQAPLQDAVHGTVLCAALAHDPAVPREVVAEALARLVAGPGVSSAVASAQVLTDPSIVQHLGTTDRARLVQTLDRARRLALLETLAGLRAPVVAPSPLEAARGRRP